MSVCVCAGFSLSLALSFGFFYASISSFVSVLCVRLFIYLFLLHVVIVVYEQRTLYSTACLYMKYTYCIEFCAWVWFCVLHVVARCRLACIGVRMSVCACSSLPQVHVHQLNSN